MATEQHITPVAVPARTRRWAVGIAMAAVLTVVVGSALSTTGPPTVPDGFAVVETQRFVLAHPETWQRWVDEPDEVRADGPVATPGGAAPSVRAAVSGPLDGADFATSAYTASRLGALTTGPREYLPERPVELSGADEAWLIESTWLLDDPDGPIRMRQIDVFGLRDDVIVYLGVSAPDERFGDTELAIVDSFRLVTNA